MNTDKEIIERVISEDGSVLFFPLLEILHEKNPDNKLEFIKEILRMDKSAFSEEKIETEAISILNIHLGKEPMPVYSLPFHK